MFYYIAACLVALLSLERNLIVGKIWPNIVLIAQLANVEMARIIGIAAIGDILMEIENYDAALAIFAIVHCLIMRHTNYTEYHGPYEFYIIIARITAALLHGAFVGVYALFANKKFNKYLLFVYVAVINASFDYALAAGNSRLIFAAAAFVMSDFCIAMTIGKKINNYVVLPLYWLSLYLYSQL